MLSTKKLVDPIKLHGRHWPYNKIHVDNISENYSSSVSSSDNFNLAVKLPEKKNRPINLEQRKSGAIRTRDHRTLRRVTPLSNRALAESASD